MFTALLVLISFLFMFFSHNLLLTLLILEIYSFLLIFMVSFFTSSVVFSDFLLIILFSVFVMEGVIALSGLILLVSFTGSDYLSSFSFMKL